MFTVPTMVGVRSRRNSESRVEMTIGSNDDATTSVPSSAGPLSASAAGGEPDEGSRRAHGEDVAGSDAADASRLQGSADAADGDCTEHGPGQVRFARARGPNHDRRDQHDAGHAQNHELQAAAESERRRRILVGLVANGRAGVRSVGAHAVSRLVRSAGTGRTGYPRAARRAARLGSMLPGLRVPSSATPAGQDPAAHRGRIDAPYAPFRHRGGEIFAPRPEVK